MSEEVRIKTETLKSFADQARRLGEVETELSTAEMLSIFESAPKEKNLPSAEEAVFGTQEDDVVEYSILSHDEPGAISNVTGKHYGSDVVINETFSLRGFRLCGCVSGGNYNVKAWDAETLELVAEATVKTTYSNKDTWYETLIDVPVNLVKGKTYTLTLKGSSYSIGYQNNRYITANPKVTYKTGLKIGPENECPTESVAYSVTSRDKISVCLVMGAPLDETDILEYKVYTETMDDIADEVKRITGTNTKLTTEQILTSLKGIAALTA